MVYNYDIYYKTGPKSAQSYRITKTAVPGIIYNGVPDWLYEGLLVQCSIKKIPQMAKQLSPLSTFAHAIMYNVSSDEWIVCMNVRLFVGLRGLILK